MINPSLKMDCKRCNKSFWVNRLPVTSETAECKKSKCWIQKPIALQEAARLAECNVDDFIKPEKGSISTHKETHYSMIASNDDELERLHGMFC